MKTVTDEVWARVEAHFDSLRQMAPEQRAAGLAAIPDGEVRREVAGLLNPSEPTEDFAGGVASAVARLEAVVPGERLGAYRLLRRLGGGGQGIVFEAVRDDGRFDQRVAIKIVKWEIDSEATRRRLREERQMLAGLEHPYIARLLDGGETSNGAPYLVMEFVEGLSLIDATQGWSLRQKLELFLKVAEGLGAAHRKLIVHRDLKPANILVTPNGNPKLLDFGIAKLLDAGGDRTLTVFQALTPEYASPEQVRGTPISTSSDVYSLGVVLYQLLTGRKPYRLETVTPLEMDRVICQEAPAPAGLDDEVDAILGMALRKEPERRYGSVEQFAEDVRRYLEQRPIVARPDTVTYRARKYAHRHWMGLLAGSLALGGVLGGAGVAVYQARIAQQRFEQVRKLAHQFIFNFDDQVRALPGSITVREMMVTTALEYLNNLSRDAHGDRALEWELGKAYEKVGDVQGSLVEPSHGRFPAALESFWKAARLQEDLAQRGLLDREQRESLVRLYAKIEVIYRTQDQTDASQKAAERGLFHARNVSDRAAAQALSQLALAQIRAGELSRALDNAHEGEALLTRALATDPKADDGGRVLTGLYRSMGLAEVRMVRFEEAAAHFRKCIEFGERQVAEGAVDAPRRLILDYQALGDALGARDRFSLGRTAEAVTWYRKSLALCERMSALDPENGAILIETARSAGKLAAALEREHPAEAIALYQRALELSEKALPEGSDREFLRAAAYSSLAAPLARLGKITEARQDMQAAIAINESSLKQTPEGRVLLGELADNWHTLGDVEKPFDKEKSLTAYRTSLAYADRAAQKGPRDLSLAFRQVDALEALVSSGDPQAAVYHDRLVALWTKWNELQPGSSFIEGRLRAAGSAPAKH